MLRAMILWLMGVPLVVVLLIWYFSFKYGTFRPFSRYLYGSNDLRASHLTSWIRPAPTKRVSFASSISRPQYRIRHVNFDRLGQQAEMGWCPRRQLAICVYSTRFLGAHNDLGRRKSAHAIPFGVGATAQTWKQTQKFPPVIDFQTIKIQPAIIHCSVLLDSHAAAINFPFPTETCNVRIFSVMPSCSR